MHSSGIRRRDSQDFETFLVSTASMYLDTSLEKNVVNAYGSTVFFRK